MKRANAKAQEYRLKKYFENHPDIELIEYYGSREKDAGDFLIRMGNTQYRVDHKSTTDESTCRIVRDWYPKLAAICIDRSSREGLSTPLHTISILNHRIIWALYARPFYNSDVQFRIKPGKKSLGIKSGLLYDMGKEAKMDMEGYLLCIGTLDNYIKEVLKNG